MRSAVGRIPLELVVRRAHAANDDLVSASVERGFEPNRSAGGSKVVGIHTGILMAEPSTPPWQEYSVIGETVNLASRLESLKQAVRNRVADVCCRLRNRAWGFHWLCISPGTRVAGFERPVRVYHYPAQAVEAAAVRQEYAV